MSIRFYLFAVLTSVVLIISALLSYQSAHFFFESSDNYYSGLMVDIGKNHSDAEQIFGHYVTKDWQQVPEPVRRIFKNPPSEYNKKFTEFVDWIVIAPPEKIYSLMAVKNGQEVVYVSWFSETVRQDVRKQIEEQDGWFNFDPIVTLILVAIVAICLFVLVLLFIFKRLAKPSELLESWAKKLSIAELEQPLPDFKFKELNAVAKIIHQNIASEANAIQREQEFLRYASHELRTPIAVLRANTTLLEKVNPNPSEKERNIRERIVRASLTMKSMTETLLWLSRDEGVDMAEEQVSLAELLRQSAQELNYLLNGKDISVEISGDDTLISVAKTPCEIVINNLVRNAFQHTQEGCVFISQQQNRVTIKNVENEREDTANASDLGFGLGMQLVNNLVAQFNWQIESRQDDNSHTVNVRF